MNKIYTDRSYIIVERTGLPNRVYPKTTSEYQETDTSFQISKYPNIDTIDILLSNISDNQWTNESGNTTYTVATFRTFLRTNTAFRPASTGGGGGGESVIIQTVTNYDDLEDGMNTGEIAYVEESQGTAWLPAGVGGTFYPKGLYLWDGSEWNSDRNQIASQFNINRLSLENKADDTDLTAEVNTRSSEVQTINNSLGTKANTTDLTAETTARELADTNINTDIGTKANTTDLTAETTARELADTNTDTALETKADVSAVVDALDLKADVTALSGIEVQNVASGFALGLQQALLTADAQPGLTVLAVGFTTTGKVQGCSLGAGNVIEVFQNGTDYTNGTVLYREFMNRGEVICFSELENGSIITSTQGFYGFSDQSNPSRVNIMPLLSYGLSFKSTLFFAFRDSAFYGPFSNTVGQGWIHVINGPLVSDVKLTDGLGVTVQSQENIILQPWEYQRFYTDGNKEYILESNQPVMACINAKMSLNLNNASFLDNRVIMPLTNDGITWPRRGFVSAQYPDTIVNWYSRKDNLNGSLNSGLGVTAGTPVQFDAPSPLGTGQDAGNYNPDGVVRVQAVGLISAYSGADSAGGEASSMMPTAAMAQVIAQPMFIADSLDGARSGVAIASPFTGTARIYSYNTTTNELDLEYTVPLIRNNTTITTEVDQRHPSSGAVSNDTAVGTVLLNGQLNPGLIISDVPITVVIQNSDGNLAPMIRSQNGTEISSIGSASDETLSLGITPTSIKVEISEGVDGLLYRRAINLGIDTWEQA